MCGLAAEPILAVGGYMLLADGAIRDPDTADPGVMNIVWTQATRLYYWLDLHKEVSSHDVFLNLPM